MADNLTDPQAAVNAALGGPTPPIPTPPTPPEPVAPPAPPAPVTPPEPVIPPTPAPADPVPPVAPVEPPSATAAPTAEDMPLAFMAPPSPTSPASTPLTTVSVEPSPTIPVMPPKKKSKLGVVLAGIVGLFVVLGGSLAGYLYYTENLPPKESTIASIQTQYPDPASCNGTCDNGRQLRWDYRNERCEDSGKSCTGTGKGSVVVNLPYDQCTMRGSPTVWCDGCGGFCITPIDKTCNQMQVEKCGESPVFGASCSTQQSTQFFKGCDCDGNGSNEFWFDANGECKHETTPGKQDGLCAVASMTNCATNGTGTGTELSCDYTCNNSGCTCNSSRNGCQIYHWKCDRVTDLAGGCQDGTPKISQSASFSASCGAEQIDVRCHNDSVAFRTRVNEAKCGAPSKPPTISPSPSPSPSRSPSPSPSGSVTPTMACTGITKNVVAPGIGDKVTFTCAGTTTPAALGSSLAYNFRYSINSGNWQSMTNKTATTTELTVDACGTYAVQCRACLTVAGVVTCDPIWQGATQ